MLNKIFRAPLVRVCARYGAIAGGLCMLFLVSLFYMGKHPFLVNPFLDFRVPLFAVLIFFALKEVRDYYQEGVLFFWQGTGGSLIFVAVCSVIAAAGIMLFGALQPLFLADYVTEFTRQIENLPPETVEQIGKDVVAMNLEKLPTTTIRDLAGLYVWQSFIMSFFISVIISVILRRQPATN
ncbi:MAG TPA: DUF4199 domain-containing protein [Cyclobacteriaceae bacterium]|nr:DUF4199 domain-containing protein [Cyclobacteriaceae bacterium]